MAKTFWLGCKYSIHVPFAPGPLPSRNSAPKLDRINTSRPKTRWFRTIQGVMHATQTSDARTMPAKEDFPRFHRRHQTHSPEAGRNESREVLVNAEMPHSSPNSSHGFHPSLSSKSSVSQKITARRRAARLVSHTQRVHQYITEGSNAHVHDVQTATFSLKHLFAMRKIGIQVSAEKKLLIESKTNADVWL